MEETQTEMIECFIGIPVAHTAIDEAGGPTGTEFVDGLRREIAEQFDLPYPTWAVPAHCALIPPFAANTDQITFITKSMREQLHYIRPFKVIVDGFGGIESHVRYLRVQSHATPLLEVMRACVQSIIQKAGCELPPDLDGTFHVPLATDIPDKETFAAIGAFLDEKGPFSVSVLATNQVILYEHVGRLAPQWKILFRNVVQHLF